MMNKIQTLDKKIAFYFPQFYHHKVFSSIIKFIASIGDFGMIWIAIVLLLMTQKGTRELSIDMLEALLLATLIGQVTIKSIVRRQRPCQRYHLDNLLVPIPNDFSFPSGHTTSSFACATTVLFFHPMIGIIFMIFAVMMGFSRIYLFVHYFSDVIFAALLGTLVGILIVIL